MTALLLLAALYAIAPFTQARYLWHPNEQPLVHDFSPPMNSEHHILNFAAPPSPVVLNSQPLSALETNTKKEHSSTAVIQQPTLSAPILKPSLSSKPPSLKETKPVATTTAIHPTHLTAIPKQGSTVLSDNDSATMTSVTSLTPTSLLPSSSSDTSNTSGTSSGAVAGIVIAVIALIGAVTAFMLIRKNKKQAKAKRTSDPFTRGFGSHDPPTFTSHDPPTFTNYHQDPPMTAPYTQNVAMATSLPPDTPMTYYQDPVYTQGSLGIFNVVSTYAPTLSDEIDIQMGDQIELLVEYDDGWCQGVNLTRGQKGVFPRHCVEHYPGQMEPMHRVSSMVLTH